jgi:hydroxymethylbilane synthase
MPSDSVVGTSSPRRRAQIVERYPQLRVEEIRGNVDTRINKAREGQYAGVILAGAGMIRLGRRGEITSYFGIDEMTPAAGQGIVAIECLRGNTQAAEAAASITHAASALAAHCERGVLLQFGERLDCYSAVAVHATSDGPSVDIRAFVSDFDGTRRVRARRTGRNRDAVINAVYDDLVAQGAVELICRK